MTDAHRGTGPASPGAAVPADPASPRVALPAADGYPFAVPGRPDPEGESPWAMQLVMRLERLAPSTRTDVCQAAGAAVVSLLADPRVLPGGEWEAATRRWLTARIRKHARRARGAAWHAVQALPGSTVTCGTASVRALVPMALDTLPREVARLQLSGTEPEDPQALRSVDPVPGGPVVVSICPEPFLPLGKAAAASGHAAQLAAGRQTSERLAEWAATGFTVVVEQPDVTRWRALSTVAPVRVVDGGLTVVAPGTVTALSRWV